MAPDDDVTPSGFQQPAVIPNDTVCVRGVHVCKGWPVPVQVHIYLSEPAVIPEDTVCARVCVRGVHVCKGLSVPASKSRTFLVPRASALVLFAILPT